jgi:hypothetical protein
MSDPNRLFGKGQRDPGRLLREEKFRRRIARELPKVRAQTTLWSSMGQRRANLNRIFLQHVGQTGAQISIARVRRNKWRGILCIWQTIY